MAVSFTFTDTSISKKRTIMKTVEISVEKLHGATWNANRMEPEMQGRLRESILRYGLVENLVVRQTQGDNYEVLSGNQRLEVLFELGVIVAPCVVVEVDDANARLLAQALNRIQGQDDLGLRAELMKKVLETIPENDILAILPETNIGLRSLRSLGKETMVEYLMNWEKAKEARLRHLQFQLTSKQLEVVEKVIHRFIIRAKEAKDRNPNVRGTALYLLCLKYLEEEKDDF
jgi:ParB family transcriptional regulator, chromosome partitioning protein